MREYTHCRRVGALHLIAYGTDCHDDIRMPCPSPSAATQRTLRMFPAATASRNRDRAVLTAVSLLVAAPHVCRRGRIAPGDCRTNQPEWVRATRPPQCSDLGEVDALRQPPRQPRHVGNVGRLRFAA